MYCLQTRPSLKIGLPLVLVSTILLVAEAATTQTESPRPNVSEILPTRGLLRWERLPYRNLAFDPFTNYPNHTFPYEDEPKAYYGPLGDYLITGYDNFLWHELRRPGLRCSNFRGDQCGSTVLNKFTSLLAWDSYGEKGYTFIIGATPQVHLTPLTLSTTRFNGIRLDVSTPHFKFTGLSSRLHFLSGDRDDATLLLGARTQFDLGPLQLGFNGVNLHMYDSTRPGNSLKGRLHSKQPPIDWVAVRIADDSDFDGRGGARVQRVSIVINGQARPDIHPQVIRHQAGVAPQMGTFSPVTGNFLPNRYNRLNFDELAGPGDRWSYRDREVPMYADYLTRLDHEAGLDVSGTSNLEGLLQTFQVEPPEAVLEANGTEQLVYLFDVSREPYVESVRIEALVDNDYRVDVAWFFQVNPRGRYKTQQFYSSFYHTVARAPGNIQDGSNIKKVRFDVGEQTALFLYSADLKLVLPGLELEAETARSALVSRYPASSGINNREILLDRGPRFMDRGAAHFINAVHWFEGGRVGAEYFSMQPDYATEMRTYTDIADIADPDRAWDYPSYPKHETFIWRTVADNDDADSWADRGQGLRHSGAFDAVYLDQDKDNDGIPDTNRNLNAIPDYEEPFLMFHVEPNDYVYGLDRNNNGEPDAREDDVDPDYPYDADQRGYHLFGQLDLGAHGALALGRYAVRQIAGSGRTRSIYGLLTFERENVTRSQRIFFENHFRRVQDDIPDAYVRDVETIQRQTTSYVSTRYSTKVLEDPLRFRNSYVNDTDLEAKLAPLPNLKLRELVRLQLNWQLGGRLPNGGFQPSRRLDFLTTASSIEYTWQWGHLEFGPRFKLLHLRQIDRAADVAIRSETQVIPILMARYLFSSRSSLRLGIQGMGPLPYRVYCGRCGSTPDTPDQFGLGEFDPRNPESFTQRNLVIAVTNRSKYFGYDLWTLVGYTKEKRKFDDPLQSFRNFHTSTFFVRAFIGFGDLGPAY